MTRAAVALLAALLLPVSLAAASPAPVTVLAAASLTDVFPRIDKGARYSFAGSDQLALQVRQGAPADVYAAASPKYPELLYRDGIVYKPITFATNRLVVVVPRSNPGQIRSVYDLRRSGLKIAIGDRTVPIGTYSRQILDTLGISADVLKNVVTEETDVKGIVAKVALGEVDAGFVYSTDAKPVAAKTRVVALPSWAQPSIRYELAIVRTTSRLQAARAFVQRVLSQRGRKLLAAAGFGLPRRR